MSQHPDDVLQLAEPKTPIQFCFVCDAPITSEDGFEFDPETGEILCESCY